MELMHAVHKQLLDSPGGELGVQPAGMAVQQGQHDQDSPWPGAIQDFNTS